MLRRATLIDALTLVAVLCFLMAGVALFQQVQALGAAADWVLHTREVLQRLDRSSLMVSEAEAQQRAYLITREPAFGERYETAAGAAIEELHSLVPLTADNPRQQELLGRLIPETAGRLENLRGNVARAVEGAPLDLHLLRESLASGDRVRVLAAQAHSEEERLLEERLRTNDRAKRRLLATAVGTALLGLLLLLALRAVAFRDRRRLVQAQDEVRAANEALEARVEARTRELADANADLEAFARSVAHDLRAPLRNIEGFAQALREDEHERMSADGQLFIERISAGVARMDRLITDLLDYSRIGRGQFRLEPVLLRAALDEAVAQVSSEVEASQVELQVPPALPAVQAHHSTLVLLLANLLGNSIKFVPTGRRPVVAVHAQARDGRVRVCVDDNGIGIAPEHRERVFRVFERLHGQERYPGTGIGLAIVRRAMERMGGTVAIDDSPLGGSRFQLEFAAA